MRTTISLAIVTLAESLTLVSAALVAVIVALVFTGSIEGALYCPLAEIVPVSALPPTMPLTAQVTTEFVVPVTVAWKFTLAPSTAVAPAGETLTTTTCGPLPPPLLFPPPPLTDPVHAFAQTATTASTIISAKSQIAAAARLRGPQLCRPWL